MEQQSAYESKFIFVFIYFKNMNHLIEQTQAHTNTDTMNLYAFCVKTYNHNSIHIVYINIYKCNYVYLFKYVY